MTGLPCQILKFKIKWVTTHPLEWLLLKKKERKKIASVDQDVEKFEPWCTVGGNVKWYSQCGKQYGISSKSKNRITI